MNKEERVKNLKEEIIEKLKEVTTLKELNDLKIRKLETYTKPANLQKITGQPLDVYMRDVKRAEIIKQIIKEE